MGKNILGGKNYKKHKKSPLKETELLFREDEKADARIIKQLGDGRFECQIFNTNTEINPIGKIRGSIRNKVWIEIGDFVLISTRNFDSSSCDIIHKYTDDNIANLKTYGEISSKINYATSMEIAIGNFDCCNDNIEFNEI